MKTLIATILAVTLLVTLSGVALAAKPDNNCTTIKDGILTYSTGHYLEDEPIPVGYDIFGYNYQAHMFNGYYCNAYLGRVGFPPYEGDAEAYLAANPTAASHWTWPYRDVQLMMKWSDTWLSNKDCNDDGKLDRGYACDPDNANSSACEGAWLTNHQRGTDEDGNWTYYVKIVCPPGGVVDEDVDGIDDNTGAPTIWGGYIVLQRVDSGEGATNYAQPVGFGAYK